MPDMPDAVLALVVADFCLIAALPHAAFRRDGHLTAGWLVTALPFFLAVPVLLGGALDLPVLAPLAIAGRGTLDALSAAAAASSFALIAWTARSHHARPALWHQPEGCDDPVEIVTRGPYARIRHPFYAGFLLAFAAAFAALPNAFTAALLGYAALMLRWTAAREESRLLRSAFGNEYRAYMARTGRFLPRWVPAR